MGAVAFATGAKEQTRLIGAGLGRVFFQDTTALVGVDNVSNDFVRVPAVSDTELSNWLSIPDPLLTVSSLRQVAFSR